MIINEYTRRELVNMSKTPGFDRYKRRLSVKKDEVEIEKVVIGTVQPRLPHLDVYFKVRGYTCGIRLMNYMERVRMLYRSKGSNEQALRPILELAMKQTLAMEEFQMSCTCPDFYYRFSYSATINHYGMDTHQRIPARIRNPHNEGSGCKHLTRIINAPSLWRGKVITALHQTLRDNPDLLER